MLIGERVSTNANSGNLNSGTLRRWFSVNNATGSYLGFYLPDYFVLLLTICLIISVGLVWFFAKRHANPHFRPRKAEVLMMSLLLLLVSGAASWVAAKMLNVNIDPAKMREQVEAAQRQTFSGKGSGESRKAVKGVPELSGRVRGSGIPENAPEAFREAFDGN